MSSDFISLRDLEFDRVPRLRRSSRGTPFTQWIPVGMPRIPPKFLDNVFYLYHDESNARQGKDFGGTGFLVGIPSSVPGHRYVYAVSNWHVAVRDGASVIRLNTKDGGTDIFDFGPEEWEFDPHYDIAVKLITLNPKLHKASLMGAGAFVTKESITEQEMGPGEDVFMIGRFIDHDGGAANRPAVRFGNISVMPSKIVQPNGQATDAYCIDLHSRSGYSGSPVFIYRTPGYDLENQGATSIEDSSFLLSGANYLGLLGIHFAQFPEKWELAEGPLPKDEGSQVPLIREGAYVKGLSGMTCLLPAWTILEVLNMPKLKNERDAWDRQLQQSKSRSGSAAPEAESSSSASPLATDENPTHREDFTRLVGAAARKPAQEG